MRNREKRILRGLWSTLHYTLSTQDWTDHGKALLALTLEESRNHNRGRPREVGNSMGLNFESKYFAVLRVVEYLTGAKPPKAEDYISMQKSCFYAYSLTVRFREFLKAWLENNPSAWQLLLWDYATMVKSDNVPPYYPKLDEVTVEPRSSGEGFFLSTLSYGHRQFYGPTLQAEALKKAVVNWESEKANCVIAD